MFNKKPISLTPLDKPIEWDLNWWFTDPVMLIGPPDFELVSTVELFNCCWVRKVVVGRSKNRIMSEKS